MSLVSEPPSKRLRDNDGNAVVEYRPPDNDTNLRTSSLPAPTMQLSGHQGSVYTLQYSPDGETLASGGFDMKVFLWSHSDYHNYNVLEGHKNAILDLSWFFDNTHLVTASADKTLVYWDAATGDKIRKFQHDKVVNAVDTSNNNNNSHLFLSASDDTCAKLWDCRQKKEITTLQHEFQVTSAALDTDSHKAYTGGIDNLIVEWDIRDTKKTMGLKGHTDTITSLAIHPKGTHLLSNAMDHSIKTWDIRPFCAAPQRLCKTFVGAKHSAEKGLLKASWSPDGSMIASGSADRMVRVFDEPTSEELYLLPGHKGCVNTVIFHPKENVIASGSSDKMIFVGELGQ
ncbi:U5 small nuclear ribonucleoprotein 40 kDa protein [Seminavis robusta]|uniref:U5 small nuclear ribonucleoprotein 40 kDa protein n=1 Tax=Seminavis robusta TaxID=568900 RepID=A0A9N8EZ82_9STRA|nr:U5 small nuclear ribonucleoprotein 40 kDa protein [Seminavis robusta]|eukprot:Sro3059_g342930.1 U5 small nuclear ribonucleoprotein 40 kDa protein (342) ;mRNA; f:4289-5314